MHEWSRLCRGFNRAMTLALIGLCGCTAPQAGTDWSPEADSGTGLAVVSLTYANADSIKWVYGPESGSMFAYQDIVVGADNLVAGESPVRGKLAVLRLKPGGYLITAFGVNPPRRYVMIDAKGKQHQITENMQDGDRFSIVWNIGRPYLAFEVVAGRATYLGNLHLDVMQYVGEARGIPYVNQTYDISAHARFGIRDEAARDLALFRAKYPGVPATAVHCDVRAVDREIGSPSP